MLHDSKTRCPAECAFFDRITMCWLLPVGRLPSQLRSSTVAVTASAKPANIRDGQRLAFRP